MKLCLSRPLCALACASIFATFGCSSSDNGNGGGNNTPGSNTPGSNAPGDSSPGGSSDASKDSEIGAALFRENGGTATPNAVVGLWSATFTNEGIKLDLRMRLSSTKADSAVKCTLSNGDVLPIAGTSSGASVSDSKIEILANGKDVRQKGGFTCTATISKSSVPACPDDESDEEHQQCFVVDGKKLRIYGNTPSDVAEFNKVRD